MRREEEIGRWAAIGAVLLAASACSPQCGRTANTPVKTTPVAAIPSPSPTPTAPLQAASPPFHGGEVGLAYSPVAFTASGGKAPYSWTVSSGALPGGLTLGSDGSVSGTPTQPGDFTFSIQVADAGSSTASIPGTISIAPALSARLVAACAQYCKVELGCLSVCGGFGQLSGGVAPYAYALTQGPLPAGTTLNGLSLAGTFKGLPGYLKFTVRVTDALGAVGLVAPTFWMYDHIALGSGSCAGTYGTGCSVTLPLTGGVLGSGRAVRILAVAPNNPGPNQPQCWSATPPAGVGSATIGSGSVTVSVPRGLINGYGAVWTVEVDEQTPCATSTDCTSNQATVVIGVQCG